MTPINATAEGSRAAEGARGWINMQATYDLKTAVKLVGKKIEKEIKPREARKA